MIAMALQVSPVLPKTSIRRSMRCRKNGKGFMDMLPVSKAPLGGGPKANQMK